MAVIRIDRSERLGLGAAVAGHAVLFGLLSIGLMKPPAVPSPPPVSVTLVGETALKPTAPASPRETAPSVAPVRGDPETVIPEPATPPAAKPAPPLAKVAPPQPAPPVAKPKQPPVTRAISRPDPPKPAPKPQAKPAPKPAAKPVTQPAAKPLARTVAPSAAATAKPAAKPTSKPAQPATGSRLGKDFLKGISDSGQGRVAAPPPAAAAGPEVQRSLSQQISRELRPHWKVPAGVDAEQLVTVLAWNLDASGKLIGRPRLIRQSGINASNKPQAALHAENAIAAVIRASPFDLPAQHHSVWKHVESFEFNRKLAQ